MTSILKTAAAALGLSVFFAGCASAPPVVQTTVRCNSKAQCDSSWSKAQAWILGNSRYRIQTATDSIIQTYGPMSGRGGFAYEVAKIVEADGSGLITIRAICYATIYGCIGQDPEPAARAMAAAIRP